MPFFRLQPLLADDPSPTPPNPAFVFSRPVTFAFHGHLLGGALSVVPGGVTAPSHHPAPTPCPHRGPRRGSPDFWWLCSQRCVPASQQCSWAPRKPQELSRKHHVSKKIQKLGRVWGSGHPKQWIRNPTLVQRQTSGNLIQGKKKSAGV